MIELSPYYFSSTDKDNSFTISYYPINDQWRVVISNKKKVTDYWISRDQAINIKDLFVESLNDTDTSKEAIYDDQV